LYLCGASTVSHGVAGAAHSGVEAAAQILQVKAETLMQTDADQKLRIYDAENADSWPDFIKSKIENKTRRFTESI
jgi:all-trans-retinol 13,14-reductase